jgi:hypothetical protein
MAVAEHNVTPQRSQSVIIKISRDWDSGVLQTARLQPRGSVAALLSYELDPSLVDSGMPPIVAEAFGRALPQFGMIAGYWFDHTPPEGDVQFLPAKHNLVRRVIRRFTGKWGGDLVLTRSPATTAELLDQGWAMQFQLLLVLDPGCDAHFADAFTALRKVWRWDEYELKRPVIALIAPGVDGDFALLAADSEYHLSGMLDILTREFIVAGFQVESGKES